MPLLNVVIDDCLNMVFNILMNKSQHIIDQLGGPSKVAELLGWKDKPGQVQRIHNWKSRGIPARVLLDRPDVFGKAIREIARGAVRV